MKNKELKETIYRNVYQNASEGYVLTPSELAFEMVSTLPNDVFVSSDTTFLDPICKSGTFLFEIAEKLYNQGHSIGNIEKRIYTIDNNSHSLNVANRYIKKILNKESGSFLLDFKSDFSESFFNSACNTVSAGRYKTFSEFINTILVEKNKSYLMTELKLNVSEFIERYEKVSKLESKLFGEVFTPRQLIDEMLDTLPEDVWTNKDLKWLDPAVGIGNFPAAIVDRLMVGLKDEIPVDSDRYKWIMEEMLYMCDISIKNLFLLYKLFDANNEFKLNVYRGSFLTEDFDNHMKEVWRLEGFDVVVGNPPYQLQTDGPKSKKIDKEFIANSLSILNKDGFLNFVSPKNNILFLNGVEINQERLKKSINIISIFVNNVERYFKNIGTDFCYYLVQNNNLNKVTLVNGEYNVKLKNGNVLPYDMDKNSINIISKCLNYKNEWSLKKSRIEKDLNDTGENKIITKILSNGFTFEWTDRKHEDMFKPKVLFALYGNNYIIDYENNLFSGRSYVPYIITKNNEESENLINLIDSKIFKFLIKKIDTMQYPFEFVLKNIKKVDFSKKWTDEDLYLYFSINNEEIEIIKNNI